ncbi:hypothetical protein Acr_26g0005070 [Actinidia rufa]|uniref:Uncharacterized protein n=1 Tax=Actinidia rufa TaxID=165716 RepID=A0A7J0H2B4_9ERIC|nr:hypothetical protein Acr_26g0005070 [Actinidia rufa]
MAPQSNDGFDCHETRREHPLVPRTPSKRGSKLLADAQRAAKGPSRKRSVGRADMGHGGQQSNKASRWTWRGPFEVRSTRQEDPPRGDKKGQQAKSYTVAKSRSDSKIVASGKRKESPSRTHFEVDFHETVNAKRSQDGDLLAKLLARTTLAAKNVIPKKLVTRTARPMPREQLLRHQKPFSLEIEGMDPVEKFNPPKFMLYDGKSNLRLHTSYFRQLMVLWNHSDALMCMMFSSSLADIELKWFKKLPTGTILSFHQLFKSFMT